MMNGCTTKKEIKGIIYEKNGWLYMLFYLYFNGKRKPTMVNTGFSAKGYHKREAKEKLKVALKMFNSGATLEMVKGEVEGAAFKKAPKPLEVKPTLRAKVPFIKQEIFETFMERGEEFPPPKDVAVYREAGQNLRGSRGRNGNLIQVADYFRNWIENYDKHIRETSYVSYKEQMDNRVIPYFSQFNITLTELCSYDITLFYRYCFAAGKLDGRPGEVSSSTVNRVHSYLSKGLSDAVRERLIQSNPARDAEIPPNNEYIMEPYTEEEMMKIVKGTLGDACEFPILMGCSLGTRRGECLGIRERAFDPVHKTIHINHTVTYLKGKILCQDKTKSEKSNRVLPLDDVQAEYVALSIERNRKLRAEFGPSWNPEGYLCVWDDGTLVCPNVITNHLQKIVARLGLPVKRMHDIRHSVISIMMKRNVNMRKIQGIAGHSDIKVTEKYAHFNTEDLRAATQTIGNAIPLGGAVTVLASNL
jgi:integrase